jgi:hypothetical protein
VELDRRKGKIMKRMVAISLTLLSSGCGTGIVIRHLDSNATSQTGIPWNLAMTQYNLTITRQVTKCTSTFSGTVTVAATVGKTLDREQQYLLASNGWMATSDITATLAADGTSLGLNAHSEDQTASVISSVISLAAEAAIIGAAPVPGAPTLVCTPGVQAALKELHPVGGTALKDLVNADTDAVTAATAKVTLLTAQSQAENSYKPQLAKAEAALAAAQAQLTSDQTKLAKDLKITTDTQQVLWPLAADQLRADHAYKLPAVTLNKWVQWSGPWPGTPPAIDATAFDVSLALYRPDGGGGWAAAVKSVDGDVSVGVPVRMGRIGRLLVCTGPNPCPPALSADWTPTDNQSVAIQPDQTVLQLGTVYNIPVRGGTFKSEGAVIAMDANGLPTSIEVSEKAAAGATAASTAASAATQIANIPTQVAAAKLARTQAETAQITAQDSLATAQANAVTAAPTAAAQAQTTLLGAQAALATAKANAQTVGPIGVMAAQTAEITAQNNLAAAQATGATAAKVDALASQTSLLQAQAAQINAQVALTKAQALVP